MRPAERRAGPGTPDASNRGVSDEPAVLVVDDDEAMALMLVDLLQESGHLATPAHSVREALGRLQAARFMLIVSDLQMHPQGGFELLEILRERRIETPVILMSAFATPEVEARARENGAHAFLTKPFDPADLLELVAGVQQL